MDAKIVKFKHLLDQANTLYPESLRLYTFDTKEDKYTYLIKFFWVTVIFSIYLSSFEPYFVQNNVQNN